VPSLFLCRNPILSHKANTKPAYKAVGTEPVNITPNNPCRGFNGRIRGAFDGQIKHFGRKYQFPTGARDQCSAGTDILGFSGEDALIAFDCDGVPDFKSLACASLVTRCMDCCHATCLTRASRAAAQNTCASKIRSGRVKGNYRIIEAARRTSLPALPPREASRFPVAEAHPPHRAPLHSERGPGARCESVSD